MLLKGKGSLFLHARRPKIEPKQDSPESLYHTRSIHYNVRTSTRLFTCSVSLLAEGSWRTVDEKQAAGNPHNMNPTTNSTTNTSNEKEIINFLVPIDAYAASRRLDRLGLL